MPNHITPPPARTSRAAKMPPIQVDEQQSNELPKHKANEKATNTADQVTACGASEQRDNKNKDKPSK